MELKDFATLVALLLSIFNFFQARSDQKRTKQLTFEVKRQEILNYKAEIQAERLSCIESLKDLKAEILSKKLTSLTSTFELNKIDEKIKEISMNHLIKNIAEQIHSPKSDLEITHEKMLKIENELGEAKRDVKMQRQENLKVKDFIREIRVKAGI